MKRLKSSLAVALSVAAFAPVANAKDLRWSHSADITSMDPNAHYSTINGSFLGNVYESLVRYDKQMKLEPALATSWERIDENTWRFKLREGVRFHNGNPFTADDVVATLLRASEENSAYRPATFWIADVKKVDEYTVDVLSTKPHATALNDLSGVFIMDKEWLTEHGALKSANMAKGEKSYASDNANGTGPFKLVQRRPDVETHLTVNPDWWDKAEHGITNVFYRPITSGSTRVSALLSGEIDLITPAPLQDEARLNQADGIKALAGNNTRFYMLNFNVAAPELKDSNIKGKNPLASVKVRQALYQAIDFKLLTSKIMRGTSKPSAAFVAPEVQGYGSRLEQPPASYDVNAAKSLLAEAGYPDGFELGLECPNEGYVNGEQMCQAVAAMWGKIGVKTKLTITPYSNYAKRVLSKELDVFLNAWANTPQLDAFSLLNNVIRTGGTWNPGGYSNSKIDALIGQVQAEQNMERRIDLIVDTLAAYQQDFGGISLFTEPFVWGMKKNLDIIPAADGRVRLYWAKLN